MASGKKCILVVEDDADTQELLSFLLKLKEYEVQTATTIAEARQIVSEKDFNLYLIDNLLPDGQGVELCRQLRALNRRGAILFISADTRAAVRAQAIVAGACDFLNKPFDVHELERTIAGLLKEVE